VKVLVAGKDLAFVEATKTEKSKMVSVKELALMPVKGTVYVFSLPFVLAGKMLSLLYILFVR